MHWRLKYNVWLCLKNPSRHGRTGDCHSTVCMHLQIQSLQYTLYSIIAFIRDHTRANTRRGNRAFSTKHFHCPTHTEITSKYGPDSIIYITYHRYTKYENGHATNDYGFVWCQHPSRFLRGQWTSRIFFFFF